MKLRKRQCLKLFIKVLGVCIMTEFVMQSISQYHSASTVGHGTGKSDNSTYNCYNGICSENNILEASNGQEKMAVDRYNEDAIPETLKQISGQNSRNEIATGASSKLLNEIFPPRSPDELNKTLQEARDIMEPIVQEIEDIRKVILSRSELWEKPRPPSIVILSNSDYFISKLKRNSVDVLYDSTKKSSNATAPTKARIRTINIWSTKEKLMRIFKPGFFVDYASNDCSNIERGTIYGHRMAKRMFNATCSTNLSKAWKAKSFQIDSFRLGQPEGYRHKNHTHLMVGYIHVIRKGAVDLNGDVSTGRLKIVIRRCSMVKSNTIPHPSTTHVFDEVFTIAQFWGSGFYHGTVEDFTRIGPYVSFLQKHSKIRIHVKTRTGFIKAFLEHFDISSGRVVTGSVGAKILYVPAGTPCGRSAIFPTYLLSMEFGNRMTTGVQPRRSIVLIKRTTKRRFRYHNQILKMLEKVAKDWSHLKLKVEVYPDNPVPGLKDTLAMMNRAFVVIAPHGAGESNLLFSESGTVMIEGLCKSGGARAILCYRNLAQVVGHRYYGILSKRSCYTATPETIEAPLKQILNHYFN